MRRVVVVLVLVASGACRSSGGLDPRVYFESRAQAERQGSGSDTVRVTFLGTQGFLLEHGGQSICTAPLCSNPSLDHVLGNHRLVVDEGVIDNLLPKAWVENTSAILVGHSPQFVGVGPLWRGCLREDRPLSRQVSSALGAAPYEGRFWFPAPGASFRFEVTP